MGCFLRYVRADPACGTERARGPAMWRGAERAGEAGRLTPPRVAAVNLRSLVKDPVRLEAEAVYGSCHFAFLAVTSHPLARWTRDGTPPDSDLVSAQAGQNAVFRSGPWSAFVGEPGTGKSNLLAAIRAALDPKAAPLTSEDVPQTGTGPIRIEASLREREPVAPSPSSLRLVGRQLITSTRCAGDWSS
jgi:hypothetical protein